MLRKKGNKWVVTNESGSRVLGEHETKEKARAQLIAIELSKKRRGKGKW
jgi:flagellar hook protein FlgE